MDFGSTHVYAGTPDSNPYYSPVTAGNSFESLHNSLSPKNQLQEPVYESVTELMKNQNHHNNQAIYDPVYEGSSIVYDEVPREPLPYHGTLQPTYSEAANGDTAPPLPPISRTVGLQNANAGTCKPPVKKSFSATMLHKAKKLAGKPAKSVAFMRDSPKPPPLPKPNTQPPADKPLPDIPISQSTNGHPPRLPPPRLPPKPPKSLNSLTRSESSSSGGSSYIDELLILQSPGNPPSAPLVPDKTPITPLSPQKVSNQFKPLYPSLPNYYQTTDTEPNAAAISSLCAVPALNPTVKSDFDLINFDEPLRNKEDTAESVTVMVRGQIRSNRSISHVLQTTPQHDIMVF